MTWFLMVSLVYAFGLLFLTLDYNLMPSNFAIKAHKRGQSPASEKAISVNSIWNTEDKWIKDKVALMIS